MDRTFGSVIEAQRFRALARRYSVDADILLKAGRWSSAYYLSGYAVECAVKACIAKQIRSGYVPSEQWIKGCYSHDFDKLVDRAGLKASLSETKRSSPSFRRFWEDVVLEWTSELRYSGVSRSVAEEMVRAVNDPQSGVLRWLRAYW